MSDPRCKTCKYFEYRIYIAEKGFGECTEFRNYRYAKQTHLVSRPILVVHESKGCPFYELAKFERVGELKCQN